MELPRPGLQLVSARFHALECGDEILIRILISFTLLPAKLRSPLLHGNISPLLLFAIEGMICGLASSFLFGKLVLGPFDVLIERSVLAAGDMVFKHNPREIWLIGTERGLEFIVL
jgi:hypothetical protein